MTGDEEIIPFITSLTPDNTIITGLVLLIGIVFIFLSILGAAGYMTTLLSIAAYAYPIARMKAVGVPFIYSGPLRELLESGNVSECLSRLRIAGHPLGREKRSDPGFLETRLIQIWYDEISLLASIAPPNVAPFFQTSLEQAEIAEIKRIIRLIHIPSEGLREADRISPVGEITGDLIEQALRAQSLEDCIHQFHETRYGAALATAFSPHQAGGSILPLETALDHVFFTDLTVTTGMIRSDMAHPYQEYLGQVIDIQNMRTLIRTKHSGWNESDILLCLMEGGHTFPYWRILQFNEMQSVPDLINQVSGTVFDPVLTPVLARYPNPECLLLFDLALDRYHLDLAERISLVYYHTGGPLIASLVEKWVEMRNIQVILSGISAGVSPDRIRTYLLALPETV